MNARLASVIRIVKRLLSWVAALVVLLVLAGSCALYLAATGRSLPILRAIAAQVGYLVAGQHTEQLTLDVRVAPAEGRLAGTATLTVRSLEEKRQRFYFLLNDGLRIRDVRVDGLSGAAHPAAAYQLWLLTVVDIGTPVAKDASVRLTFDYEGTPATDRFSIASSVIDAQQVLLNVDAFWYPSDVQGFFTADVTVTVPSRMTVVHNGVHAVRLTRGDLQEVRWTTERPIAGLALVAGTYELSALENEGTTYRLYLPPGVQLDTARLLDLMGGAQRTLAERYGASGFSQISLFVSRDIRRAFNDGSGLMGASIRYFRAGDYGFAVIAHEIAHNWWGGTVAEQWLSPGTGGEWLVEGFAEFSSLVAAEAVYGTEALTRRLAGEFFDPAHQAALADMSVLDNALAEATARDTIYRKGAYVAAMLRTLLGDEAYFSGLRAFLERFRYRQATERDLQQVLQEFSENDLERYFADWVRSNKLADLSLDASVEGKVVVHNLGAALISGDIDLWTFTTTTGPPTRATVHVGDTVTLDASSGYAVLDPLLAWADVERQNNRYPRRTDPVYIATANGSAAITAGEPYPWVRSNVSTTTGAGAKKQAWDFDRGMSAPPAWSPGATRLIVSYSDATNPLPAIIALTADGARRNVGFGSAPAAGADGTIYAGSNDRIVRFGTDNRESTVARRPGAALDFPLPAPDGTSLVYTASRGNRAELRQVGPDGQNDRLFLSWDRDRMLYRWAADGTRLYAIAGGDWDWQVWDIPLGSDPVQVLARGAAAIADLAVSPDGARLAFTAAPAMDYPVNRRQLYVLNLGDRTVRTVDVADADLTQLAWLDTDTVLVVATVAAADRPWMLPAARFIKRVKVSDGSVEDVP